MTQKILFVDDEDSILSAYTRTMRKRFAMETASSGEEALRRLRDQGPFAVIISDMRMPVMDGIQLLARVREEAPDTIRLMLTGNADQKTAMDAVNKGAIFRFLTKPCDPELLASALETALEQHRLLTAEKELLDKTLKGAVEMMVELLGLLDPISFGRARTMADLSERISRFLAMEDAWILGVASVLSQIGILTIPNPLVGKLRSGAFLNSIERDMLNRVPEIGANLIRHIPRLDEVAEVIFYMNKNVNGTGFPADDRKGDDIPLGSRILRVVGDYLNYAETKSASSILGEMEQRTAWYDLVVLRALRRVLEEMEPEERTPTVMEVALRDLRLDMVLVQGVQTMEGLLVVPKGTRLGVTHLEKLRNFAKLVGIREPILVTTA